MLVKSEKESCEISYHKDVTILVQGEIQSFAV